MRDLLGATLLKVLEAPLRSIARSRAPNSLCSRELDRQKLALYKHHYYHPFISEADLAQPLDQDRDLPGLRLDALEQLSFIGALKGRDEFPKLAAANIHGYDYARSSYGYGDADLLYAMTRSFAPKRIIEIGAGDSTRVIRAAIDQIQAEDPTYVCHHTCIEPYEQPWLETLVTHVIREKVENLSPDFFASLSADDILFIDSSHVIRPQGDVLFEYLQVLPRLKSGVIIHAHDIFTPADYPREWIVDRKLLWDEQYLLEAFLSMNDSYEILIAANWLANRYNRELQDALPGFALNPSFQPGNFWFRRK